MPNPNVSANCLQRDASRYRTTSKFFYTNREYIIWIFLIVEMTVIKQKQHGYATALFMPCLFFRLCLM